jgi:hypothetical protein
MDREQMTNTSLKYLMLIVVLSMIAGTLSNGILYASTDDTGDSGGGKVDEPQPKPQPQPEPEPVVPEPEPESVVPEPAPVLPEE